MLKQKILEIIVIVLALLAIVFGISSCLYNDNVTILRIFSLIFIVIALILILIIEKRNYNFLTF